MSDAPKSFSRTTLITSIQGYKYEVPQRIIEHAVKLWLVGDNLFVPLPDGAKWSFEWHDDDTGNITWLVVEHLKSETKKEPRHDHLPT